MLVALIKFAERARLNRRPQMSSQDEQGQRRAVQHAFNPYRWAFTSEARKLVDQHLIGTVELRVHTSFKTGPTLLVQARRLRPTVEDLWPNLRPLVECDQSPFQHLDLAVKRIALLPEFPHTRFADGGVADGGVPLFLQGYELHPECAPVSLQPAFGFEEPRPAALGGCDPGFDVLACPLKLLDAAL